jgi:23S rRNA (uracil1939-C5)-methyltransferase
VAVQALRSAAAPHLEGLNMPPDFVLADPPRAGLGPAVVGHLLRLAPPQLTIVSCDPATLARDLSALLGGGYRLESLVMVDLFPQTCHIESVAVLRR